MFSKCKLLLTVALSSSLLFGCASSNIKDSERVYRDDLSRAKNITNFFGYKKIHDVKAPEGYKGDGSFLWNSAVWAGNLDAAANIGGFLPGASGWNAVGIGLGLSLVQAALKPDDQEEMNGLFGYLPANKAKDIKQAREVFVDEATQALLKSAKKLYPQAEIKIVLRQHYPETMMYDTYFAMAIQIVDKKLGCLSDEEAKTNDDYCGIIVKSSEVKSPDVLPEMFGGKQMAYKIMPMKYNETLIPLSLSEKKLEMAKWLSSTAPYLPKNMFFYVASQKDTKGETNPPLIVEKDHVNLFIQPKAN